MPSSLPLPRHVTIIVISLLVATCDADVKASNQAAMWLHPTHDCSGKNIGKDLCGNMYAYMHLICAGKWRSLHYMNGDNYLQVSFTDHPFTISFSVLGSRKRHMAKALRLWFLEEGALSKLSMGARWYNVIAQKDIHMGDNFTLPCPGGGIAWQ